MAVEIRKIEPTRAQLREYTKFGIDLYKGNPYFVPPLIICLLYTSDAADE